MHDTLAMYAMVIMDSEPSKDGNKTTHVAHIAHKDLREMFPRSSPAVHRYGPPTRTNVSNWQAMYMTYTGKDKQTNRGLKLIVMFCN